MINSKFGLIYSKDKIENTRRILSKLNSVTFSYKKVERMYLRKPNALKFKDWLGQLLQKETRHIVEY